LTRQTRILTVTIARPLPVVAAFLADPRNYPRWAAGLASGLEPRGDQWLAKTPAGPATVRFSPPNPFGVADHWVTLPDGTVVYVPLRAVANEEGTEVSLTLFRLPTMSDARYDEDAALVERDLASLKQLLNARKE